MSETDGKETHTMKNSKLIALIAALLAAVLCFASCGKTDEPTDAANPSETGASTEATTAADAAPADAAVSDKEQEKAVNVTVIVKDKDGKSTEFKIETKKTNLADALLEKALVTGDTTEYGLYIKTVNGIRADYAEDKAYWAILDKDGNMLQTGASSTPVAEGDTFVLAYTPADAQ